MRSVVLDASALVGFLLDARGHPRIVDLVADEAIELAAPHLVDVEVLSALRGIAQRGLADPERLTASLALLAELPIRRFDHAPLLGRAFALRENLSAYDAVYVALAEGLAGPLVTADRRLADAARRWTTVEVVEAG